MKEDHKLPILKNKVFDIQENSDLRYTSFLSYVFFGKDERFRTFSPIPKWIRSGDSVMRDMNGIAT